MVRVTQAILYVLGLCLSLSAAGTLMLTLTGVADEVAIAVMVFSPLYFWGIFFSYHYLWFWGMEAYAARENNLVDYCAHPHTES